MKLMKCVHCRVFIIHNQEEYKRHERKYHSYQVAQYEPHNHIPLTKEEKAAIVARGEARLGKHLFFGYNEPIKQVEAKPILDVQESIQYYHGPTETVK